MMTTKNRGEWKVFSGANGEYIALETSDGYHHQPSDQGSRNGWDRHAALVREAARRNGDETDED